MASKLSQDFDVIGKEPPRGNLSASPFEFKGCQPHSGDIPSTPGERASNTASEEMSNKAQPYKTKGSGYCS